MALNHLEYNTSYLLNARSQGEPLNDAVTYGVRVVQADVTEGEVYWKVLGVHHLLPRENVSKHNIYLEALNENGDRIRNPPAYAGWTWEGRRPNEPANPVPLDKPANETAGDIAVHFGQVISVWLKGVGPNSQDKSDRVENLRTDHPDERLPDGSLLNSVGHHSFYIVFQRTRQESITVGVIAGQVERGQGQTIRLLTNNQVVAQQPIGADGVYRFDNLPLGSYRLEVVNTNVSQDNIRLEATNKSLTVNLALPLPTGSAIAGRIQNGPGRILLLIKDGAIIARLALPPSGEYRFENLGAGTYSLMIFETNVRQDNIALDGSNSREINLTIQEAVTPQQTAEKVINHYLLFGPPETRGRQTNLLLAVDYVLHFSVTIGFSVAEAKQAHHVTIIGEGISPADQQALRDAGSEVEVISGDSYEIEAHLTARLQAGRAFG